MDRGACIGCAQVMQPGARVHVRSGGEGTVLGLAPAALGLRGLSRPRRWYGGGTIADVDMLGDYTGTTTRQRGVQ